MTPLHAWALVGAAVGVALPIVIHLLTRPRGQRRALPSYRFLVKGANESGRRGKLRAVLILTARALGLVCLALGFARIARHSASAGSSVVSHDKRKVIVLDCSLSMRAVVDGVSMFDRARVLAQKELEGGGVRAADLIFAAQKASPVFGVTSTNLMALHDEVSKARALPQSLDATAAIESAAHSLSGLSEDDFKHCEVVIITDLQRGNWTNVKFSALPKDIPVRMLGVSLDSSSGKDDPSLKFSSLGSRKISMAPANTAILKAHMSSLTESGAAAFAVADIANHGSQVADLDVKMVFDGRTWSRRISVAAGKVESCSMELNDIQPGWKRGYFNISAHSGVPDALADDDRYPLCAYVRSSRQISLVSLESQKQVGGPAYFLERGLCASPDSTVRVSRVVPAQLEGDLDESISRSDLIAIVNCGVLTDAQAAGLARRLSSGTPLLFITQLNTDADNLRVLQTALAGALRLPVEFQPYRGANPGKANGLSEMFGAKAAASGGRFLLSVNSERRPFKIFGDSFTRFSQSLRLTDALASTARVDPGVDEGAILAKYSDGSAALVLTSVAAGRLAVLNMSVGGQGPHLGTHPIFVPLIQELCQELLEADADRGTRIGRCGAAFTLPVKVSRNAMSQMNSESQGQTTAAAHDTQVEWRVLRGDGTELPLGAFLSSRKQVGVEGAPMLRTDAGGTVLEWTSAGEPDAYFIERRGHVEAGFTIVPPTEEESDLSVLDPEILTQRLAQDRKLTVVGMRESQRSTDQGSETFDTFFLAAVGCLFLELMLLKVFKS